MIEYTHVYSIFGECLMPSHRLIVSLLVFFFIILPLAGQFSYMDAKIVDDSSILEQIEKKPDIQKTDGHSILAADPISGVLDSVVVEQYGYFGTGQLDARTDTSHNEQATIPIDNATGWVGSRAQLELWNMERLYVENGTFDDGIDGTTYYPNTVAGYPYGWDFEWDDPSYGGPPGEQNVSTTYDKDAGYIVLQTEGQLDTSSGYVLYRHYDGTYIYWNQTIHNVPYSDNLTLTFMFNYESGIIDKLDLIEGWVWLDVLIDGDYVDYINLMNATECPSRNTWYEFTVANITDPADVFNLEIGIYIQTWYGDNYYYTNPGGDYDQDDVLDFDHTRVNRVLLDNITLLSVTQPSYDSVNLTFHSGTFSLAITELSGYGTAVISNPSYWSDSSLTVGISSNVSISCDYEVKLLSHNFGNSLWAPQPTRVGVAYSVEAGASASLSTFTYVGNEGVAIYENFTVELFIPSDWENVTIYDPFLNDVTSECFYTSGSIEIPTSLLNRLGWWQIVLESPNYAKSVTTQIEDLGLWYSSQLFRPDNLTRVSVNLGTTNQTPTISNPVNVTYYQPDASIWYEESIGSGSNGIANSTQQMLSGGATLAGEWTVTAIWSNGTEVAYGVTLFDMYHTASLVVPAEYTTVQTDVGLIISNFVYYTDADTSAFLLDDSVTITANWTGSIVPFTQDFVKNWWRGEFDTSMLDGGQYTVNVTASRPYFDNVSTQFTVIAIQKTTIEILNAGAIPIERGLNEVFTVQLDFELLNGTGISGANIDISHSGPVGGLSWYNFADNNSGHYSVNIICDISATYPITITLNKSYHSSASDSFTLIIGETGTSIVCLNGTADAVLFGSNYTVVLEYLNSTAGGLIGATLQVLTTSPTTGLNYTGFTPIADGLYTITLIPTTSGSFSIVMSASLLNHETQYVTFTLTATGIPTVLTSVPSTASISVDHNFTVQLRFQDESLNPIDLGHFTVVNPPSGLNISSVIPLGNGLYNFTLIPLGIGTYDVLFRASAYNYQSSSTAFTLVVTEIKTRVEFEGDVTYALAEFEEPYQLIVYYYRSDIASPVNVNGANISVLTQDPGLHITIDEYSGYYLITIRGQAIGTWSLTISANKTNHFIATKQFLFEVEEIDTSVQGSSPFDDLFVGRPYLFTFNYIYEANSSSIFGASVIPFGEGSDWMTFTELGSGQYSVNLTPVELGDYSVLLTFEKFGFVTANYRLTFRVSEIPISIEILQGLRGPEGLGTTFMVRLTESDTGLAITEASVYCNIHDSNENPIYEQAILMQESVTAGVYTTDFEMPSADGTFFIVVSCNIANYVLEENLIMQLQPARDVSTMLLMTVRTYYWVFLGIGAVAMGLMYRRTERRKRVRQNRIALSIKKRFDDVRSLLGVIVLHKDSGLPVYSQILREGLEEAVISAFITAITSFRREFDIETTTEEWGLIPISDIVRVISTNKLICAFITTGNPSAEQQERMIKFAKTVGFIFDDTIEDVPVVVLDHHTTARFNELFDEVLDGALLRTYKLDDSKKFQVSSCADERIASQRDEEFKLEQLAAEIAACGLEEGRVYQAIMRALESRYLVAIDEPLFATKIVRAPDTVAEEG